MKNIIKALFEIQKVAQGVKGTGENKHLKSTYVKLSDLCAAIAKPLADNGVFMTQTQGAIIANKSTLRVFNRETGEINDQINDVTTVLSSVTTSFYHVESGEVYEKTMDFPIQAQNGAITSQSNGIALSYAKRYHLMSMLGLATDDNDGVLSGAVSSISHQSFAEQLHGAKTLDELIDVWTVINNDKTINQKLKRQLSEIKDKRKAEFGSIPKGFTPASKPEPEPEPEPEVAPEVTQDPAPEAPDAIDEF